MTSKPLKTALSWDSTINIIYFIIRIVNIGEGVEIFWVMSSNWNACSFSFSKVSELILFSLAQFFLKVEASVTDFNPSAFSFFHERVTFFWSRTREATVDFFNPRQKPSEEERGSWRLPVIRTISERAQCKRVPVQQCRGAIKIDRPAVFPRLSISTAAFHPAVQPTQRILWSTDA